jgi:hypothetical protein
MSLLTLSSSKIPLNKAKEANSDEKNDSLFDSKTSCLIIAGGTLSSFLGYIFVAGVQIYVGCQSIRPHFFRPQLFRPQNFGWSGAGMVKKKLPYRPQLSFVSPV